MSRPARYVEVSPADKKALDRLLNSGVQQVRVLLRALALRHLGDGCSAAQTAVMVRLTSKAVRAVAARYRVGGLERALYDKARPGKPQLLDGSARQRLVAMVCAPAPEGRARWSVRLIVAEALRRKIVPRLGRESLRLLLESHDLKPWREKNVVRGKA